MKGKNYMHWPGGYKEHIRKWARDTYLAEIYGIYTPRLGGWGDIQ